MNSGVENSDDPVEDRADALEVKAVLKVQIDQYGQTKMYHSVIVSLMSCPYLVSGFWSLLHCFTGFWPLFFIRNQGGCLRWFSATYQVFGNHKQADFSDYMHLHIKIGYKENIMCLWMYK